MKKTKPAAQKSAARHTQAAKGAPAKGKKPKLLAGGNPQIAKAEGDAAIQTYIAAMPGWKGAVGRRLDALITRAVPDIRKAVKWNSPFYGRAECGWLITFHCYTQYVKVAFFNGKQLTPPPPGDSKSGQVRYLDLREKDPIDAAQFTAWCQQAARLPGWGKV